MEKVITLIEIRKFGGMREIVLPAGTIVTPAARDWAKDHRIRLIWEGGGTEGAGTPEREAWLRGVLEKVAAEFDRQGRPIAKEALCEAVWRCLERRGAAEK